MRRIIVSVIAFGLSGSPALAQSLHEEPTAITRSVQDAARAKVAQFAAAQTAQPAEDSYRPGGMSPGYFWTGIGLMSAGGLYMVAGAAVSSSSTFDDDGVGAGVLVFGAALAGAGAVVYILGKNKARAVGNPQVVALRHGVLVRSQFSF